MSPDEYTISEQFVDVGDGHQLYIQDWGNNQAKVPIVFLHGGPGAGCHDNHKQVFDASRQRVIFFDQRGAGKSLPKGSLEHNTTEDLVNDIEKIAKHYQLPSFVITGGSWGSCLAFAYALKYPKRVKAMVLRGVYTGSKKETDYLDKGVFRTFFPDVWEAYLNRTPKEHQDNPSAYHYRQMKSKDSEEVKASMYAYSELESSLLKLDDRHTAEKYEDFDPDAMRVELHYLGNNCFIPEQYILDGAKRLTMPIWLVQGRYDAICPPETAYEMHKRLPNSELVWTVAGHSSGDRAIYDVIRSTLLLLTA